MLKRGSLRVIPGGKSGATEAAGRPHLCESCDRLRQKANFYRGLAAVRPHSELSSLIGDLVDAIKALELLEQSGEAEGKRRAIEYRLLIAELEIEIVATLKGS